jgi:phage antirepressor YoqD-like protein
MSEHQIAPFVHADAPTMSSREIADMVDSRHDSVRRAIERLAERGVIALPPMVEKPTDGRPAQEFIFSGEKGKRDSIIVIAQLSPKHTAALVDRWQELEALVAAPPTLALNDPVALRAALLNYTDTVIALEAARTELEHQVEEIAPKAAIYDRFLNADGLMTLQDLGRALHQKPNKFIDRLKGPYLFEQSGLLKPHQRFVDLGIFQVTSKIWNDKVRNQTMATAKAVPYFAKKLEAELRKVVA